MKEVIRVTALVEMEIDMSMPKYTNDMDLQVKIADIKQKAGDALNKHIKIWRADVGNHSMKVARMDVRHVITE